MRGTIMGFLNKAWSAVAELLKESYVLVPDKNGMERQFPMGEYYTPENPPPNAIETSSLEYAARMTP